MKSFKLFSLLFLSWVPGVCDSGKSIFDTAVNNEEFTVLALVLKIAKFDRALDCKFHCMKYTVLAPSNKAFTALPNATVTQLTTDKEYFGQSLLVSSDEDPVSALSEVNSLSQKRLAPISV